MRLIDFLPEDERYRLARMQQNNRDVPGNVPGQSVEPVKASEASIVRPPAMPEEDWNTAVSVFSPEKVAELYNGFDPASVKPFYENVYQSIFSKPAAPDEKQMVSARNMAGLGDALSLIIQSVAAGRGSLIEKRNPGDDATAKTDALNNRLREAYRREREKYNAGYWGAQMKDAEGAHGDYNRDRAALLALLAKRRDDAGKDKRFAGEMAYKYEKMKSDDGDKKARLKLMEDANQIKRNQLDWQKEKYKIPQKDTPRGYLDFYDPTTGMTYRVADKKWKANYTQIFDRVKTELYRKYPLLESQERLGSLKPSEKEEYVKQFVYDNPKALKFLENIAEISFKDGEPEPRKELPRLTEEQYRAVEALARKHRKDETKALREIGIFLKQQGYKQDDVAALLKAMQE